jgi:O-antigen ligase/polysaccharide polymerase Wzy-like membrane protein
VAVASATGTTQVGGVAQFYGALWSEARARRREMAIAVEVAMVVAWFIVRTLTDVDSRAYLLWLIAAGALALVAPRSGLVVLVATSVFFEPDSLARTIAPRELIVLPLAVGVLVQIAADRFRWRPGLAIWLAVLLVAGTGLGVVHTFRVFEQDFEWHAAQSWIGNMLAPVIILIAAAWTARDGDLRVLVVAVGVGVVAAVVCLIEYAAPGSISNGPFAWVGFWKGFGARLAGTIPSPNALSTQLIVPTMVLLAAVVLARDVRLRAIALVALVPVLTAQYLTFSRAPFIALYVFVVIVAWRFRRWAGIAVLVVGLVAGALALPAYLQLRGSSVSEGAVSSGSILVASDELRFRAWGAALQMVTDKPLIGQGYLAYKELAEVFGDPVLGSPHNEWLRIFAEEGVIVGLVGVAFLIATAITLTRVPGWLGTGILAGFLGYVIAASFNNPLLFVRVSAVAFTIVGVGLALAERARAPATTSDPVDEPVEPAADPALD